MEIHDLIVIVSVLVLLGTVAYTLYNIYTFMPIEKQCEPAFTIINDCGCYPDKNIATLFHQENKSGAPIGNFNFSSP